MSFLNAEMLKVMKYKKYDTDSMMILQKLKELPKDFVLCPMFVDDMKFVMNPTLQKHYKFSIDVNFVTDETRMIIMCQAILLSVGDLPADIFESKKITIVKTGLAIYDNIYQTSLRIWNTKKVGKDLIYEVTISGFKDAIAEPANAKPKKVLRKRPLIAED